MAQATEPERGFAAAEAVQKEREEQDRRGADNMVPERSGPAAEDNAHHGNDAGAENAPENVSMSASEHLKKI